MTTVTTALTTLQAAGLALTLTPTGALSVGPKSRLTDDLRGIIRASRVELLAHLNREASNDPGQTGHQTGQPPQRGSSLPPVGGVTQPLQRKSSPTTETPLQCKTPTDWRALDAEYQRHHVGCAVCKAAGLGHGLRCGTGAALWADYDRAEPPAPTRRKSPSQPAPAREVHPSLMKPATDAEANAMAKRLALFAARGLTVDDAEKLTDRLMVRDRDGGDHRGVCAECVHLLGNGPGRWRCGDTSPISVNDLAGAHLGAGFVHLQLHHCPSLRAKGAAP